MGKGTQRANYRKRSTWNEGNDVDKRCSIGLGFLNVNGWDDTSKDDVENAMLSKSLEIFSLVETKKKPHSNRIKINGCKVFEVRRNGDPDEGAMHREGGGIAVAVRETAGVTFNQYIPKITDPSLQYVSGERLWIKYKSDHGKSAVCSVYCGFQAADNRHLKWNEGIYQVLSEEISSLRREGYRVILAGDFNAWIGNVPDRGGIPGNREKVTPNGELFLSFLRSNDLTNINSATRLLNGREERICKGLWTRHASDYVSSSILDYLVVTKEHLSSVKEMIVDQDGVYGGSSDHNMLFSRWTDKFINIPKVQPPRKPAWNIEEADWGKFRSIVNKEISETKISAGSIEHLSNLLTSTLTKGLNLAVGKKTFTPPKQALYPRHIVTLLKERKSLERIFKTAKSRFANAVDQSECGSLIVAKENLDAKTAELAQAKSKFERQRRVPLLNLAKSKTRKNRRRFWDFVNRKSKKLSSIPPLQDKVTGAFKHSPNEIAEEVTFYLRDIFSGSDNPPSMAASVDDFYAQEVEGDIAPSTSKDQHCLQKGPYFKTVRGDQVPNKSHPGPSNMDASVGDFYAHEEGSEDITMSESAAVRDHDYCINPNPKLIQSDRSGRSETDPSGFLDKDFSTEEVATIIKNLGNGKAAGHDNLINEALKEAPESFTLLLTKLFNMIKCRGKIPRAWRRGRVVLIHKKGAESDISNYRPLTVIPCMCSTYSKLLNARLIEVTEKHRLLGEIQNGFRRDRCGTDSAFILNSILWKSMAKKKKVSLAFMDLQKAYDSINRETLWKKMAAMGFGGQFLESIKSLYKDDFVTSEVNGVTTVPVYLGRGLRQGCSLSPILFAIYVADMSNDLHASNLGVTLQKICVTCLFFADDFVLVACDADGLRQLRDIVQRHCTEMDMKLSITKSKVMSTTQDIWELFDGDNVVGTIDKVLSFKYLGVETMLVPSKAASVMMNRAKSLATTYKKTVLSLSYDGPDTVDLTLCLWLNVAMPSILYGCEVVPFTHAVIDQIERIQSSVGKFTLGLPPSSPNISTSTILGVPSFRELLYSAQLKYLVRLLKQDSRRWSKDAFLDHVEGDWNSPYVKYMVQIRDELGLLKWPSSVKEVKTAVTSHFLEINNHKIDELSLPALRPLAKRARMDFANESRESKVRDMQILFTLAAGLSFSSLYLYMHQNFPFITGATEGTNCQTGRNRRISNSPNIYL